MIVFSVSSCTIDSRVETVQYTSVAIDIHFSENSVISDAMYPVYIQKKTLCTQSTYRKEKVDFDRYF